MSNLKRLSFSLCSEEDDHSINDEEKIRYLFQVCDNDGDGYIDSNDLAAVCEDLNLEYCLEDLMSELGADHHGKISYQEFVQKRLAQKSEIDALRKKSLEYSMTSSNVNLGAGSLGKQECWEFDSGARDLSPEPNTLQRLVTTADGSSLASSSGNLLQLANKIHLTALSTLRNEILDLNTRLEHVTLERDTYEKIVETMQSREIKSPSRPCTNCSSLQKENEHINNALESSLLRIRQLEQEMKIVPKNDVPVMKKAEKVQLRTLGSPVNNSLASSVSHTQMAEHLALENLQLSDRKLLDIETEKLQAKLENVKLQNTVLETRASHMRTQCERLTSLLGKYESNAIALQLVVELTDKIIANYKSIIERTQPRDTQCASDVRCLLKNIEKLTRDRSNVHDTVVKLESYHCVKPVRKQSVTSSETRQLDLEMTVLMQELLGMREDKAEMRGKIHHLEIERDFLEMKVSALERGDVFYFGTNVDCHSNDSGLSSNKNLNCQILSKTQDTCDEVTTLRGKLQDMAITLARTTRAYEMHQMQAQQTSTQLKQENASLLASVERERKKSVVRLKRLETEIARMTDSHGVQVSHLKQRIVSLENKLSNQS